jgi:outer membrane murein-binding lipoprotein Lpp
MKRIGSVWTVAFLVLVLVATASLLAAGCGSSEQKQAKLDLSSALTEFETAVSSLQKMGATSTVADLKTANASLGPLYDNVIESALKVSGVDVTPFETAWKDLQDAVAAIPDDASIVTAAISVVPKIQPVVTAEGALKAFAEK